MCNSLIELIISSIPLKSALWLQFIVNKAHILFFLTSFYFNKKINVFVSYNILMDMAMF